MSDLEPGVQIAPDTIAAMERLETPPPHYHWTNGTWPDCVRQLRTRVDELGVLIHELQTMHNTAVDWRTEQDHRLNQLEATQQPRVFTAEEVAPILVPTVKKSLTAAPAGSLVERVAQAMHRSYDHEPTRRALAAGVLRAAADR